MQVTEYVAPNGAVQGVDSAVVETRLRAAGWRPRAELEEQAPFNPAAAAQLKRAKEAAAAREQRVRARMAAAEPAPAARQKEPTADTAVQPAEPEPEPGEQESRPGTAKRKPRSGDSST